MSLHKGQRLALTQLVPNLNFSLEINLSGSHNPIDCACFAVNAQQRLLNDEYMIFFNQLHSPCGAIAISAISKTGACFSCQLNKLPATVNSLVFTITLDGDEYMRDISSGYARLLDSQNLEIARFDFNGGDFNTEKAVMLLECYRKDNNWRLNIIAQGFNGGLAALVKHFGADVLEKTPKPIETKVSLSKIILEKRGDKISLDKPKTNNGYGRIVCNLNWSRPQPKKGFFNTIIANKNIDLDLACLYEFTNGEKSVIQALGNCFGAYENFPYIYLAGDDRSGDNSEGEFLYINGSHFNTIKRICIFAFIYEGIANWAQADAVVTVSIPEHPSIEVRLNAHSNNQRACAVAMLENDNGALKLTKLDEYFSGHQELDKHYQWGMNWQRGRK